MAGPAVCVSLSESSADACAATLAELAADGAEVWAEIRLDALTATVEQVRQLFSGPYTLVATCRAGAHDDGTRARMLIAAIEGGAAYVDVGLDDPLDLRREVFRQTRTHDCRLIVSAHDFETTPARPDLERLRARCFDAGADLAKLACMVHDPQQAARLLGLLDGHGTVIVVGMGPLGRLVRIVAPLLGSPLAYAAVAAGRETAPGQLDRKTMQRWLRELARV